ncbi:NADP-dependent phosphogluconate dehydrogenase [Lichenihabitans sp. Uapishka_5]|uniref:NADP-dependent phosphogluconate dehydrogenase n=1 Tax=Lichenihabitans sp. Uapishka_5 TaxID=3037302 RepID=UPI0029E7DFAB|nr:NADP-dependent phosphogluconate dehydrogenase [Lichenihabitans sp. Uapishka_5]MDX7952993.1 NADP-dependent phosphogluconate dehydrogenase [Lichenihabitans sp. Uapishka_5]
MTQLADVGVMGLAVMGANLARNAARKGFGVALFNRHGDKTDALMRDFGHEGRFTPTKDLAAFVAALAKPRVIIIMVKAGKPVDDVMDSLLPHLEAGDIVVDGGNSLYTDTNRRFDALAAKDLRFVGMGVSGGEEGALEGPSMMPGGTREAWDRIAPMVTKMAAQVDNTPCCAYIGPGGAGHYVKMVHNGIEYADMQLITEAYDLMRTVYGMDAPAMAEVFKTWKAGDLDSYLIEITAAVLAKRDGTGKPLVDSILDEAEQKGTGRWTAANALELGVPLTGITEAVYARVLSSQRTLRVEAEKRLPFQAPAGCKAEQADLDAIRDALYASKIVAYAQGFEQMAAASKQYGWDLKLGEIATIWRGGCIIRARFLDRIREAYGADAKVSNLILQDYFRDAVLKAEPAWRRTVALAVQHGVAIPAFSSSLSYYDGLRRARGPANLLQGLRDYFGAHSYRRVDGDGAFHTRWSQDGSEVKV